MKDLLACLLLSLAVCHGGDGFCARHVVVPDYPRLARMARLQGSVSVEVQIAADGKVASAKASGNNLLERASEENVRQWTFSHAPTASSHVTITYVYRLEGKEEYYDPPPRVVLDLPYRVEITSQPPEPQPGGTKMQQ